MVTSLEVTNPEMMAMPPIVEPSLRYSFLWTLGANLFYSACQWGILSALAKLGGAAVVGQYVLGLAISAPVFMLTNLQLRGVQATDARSEYAFGHYFTLRLVASLCGIGIVAGIVLSGRYERTTAIVVMLVALSKVIESLSDVVAGLLQKHERLDQVAVGLMLRGVISVVAFTTVYRVSHRLTAAAAALVCSWAAVALCYDLRLALRLEGSVRRFFSADCRKIGQLVLLSAPLGLVMALSSLNANLPRYIIEHHLGYSELGIFAAMAYLVTAAVQVVNALGQSVSARLSRMFAEGDLKGFKSLMRKLLMFGMAMGVAGVPLAWFFGRPILTLLYAPEYANYRGTFLIMVATVGVIAMASFCGYGITAARSFRTPVLALLASSLTTCLLCLWLVPILGILGASIALFFSSLVQLGGLAALLALRLRIPK
jgi:O-antigen/teichoic acid export membrane protein